MDSKPRGRRGFLKEGAALAGLAVGTARTASGQTSAHEAAAADPPPKDQKELAKELVAYGDRSHYVSWSR